MQIDKLGGCARARSEAVEAALEALTRNAAAGNGNLLALAVDAARAKATVGEISDGAGKGVRPPPRRDQIDHRRLQAGGGMSDAVERVQRLIAAFEEAEGRRPRILVAKIGQDGHDRGQKVIASAFADLGFDVDIGPLFATPRKPRARRSRTTCTSRRLVAGRGASDAGAGTEGRTQEARPRATS
jgi:methylmalonyl-CoA mutase